jgi:hypothetical protein
VTASKEFKEEFIAQMSAEIIKELEEKAAKEGRKLTFDDIETGVLLFRQKIGEDVTNKIVFEQGTGKLKEKKTAKDVDTH